jgi:hypothetical protein
VRCDARKRASLPEAIPEAIPKAILELLGWIVDLTGSVAASAPWAARGS